MLREAMCEPAWTYSLAAHAVFADCGAGPLLPCQVSVRQSYAALTMLHALTQLEQHSHVMPTAALSQSHAMIDVWITCRQLWDHACAASAWACLHGAALDEVHFSSDLPLPDDHVILQVHFRPQQGDQGRDEPLLCLVEEGHAVYQVCTGVHAHLHVEIVECCCN